jgi:hypothetical protein
MPGATVDIGTGTTITFGTSGFTASIMSVRWSGISRPSVPTSHMGTAAAGANKFGNATFLPGEIIDPGEMTLELQFNPQTNIPIAAVPETITVTWPLVTGDSTPANWSGSGFVTVFEITDPLDEKMTATMTIKMSGNVSYVDAA